MLSPMNPLFFLSNRVWRCYTGGLLLDRFLGHAPGTDTYYPEDWLASCVEARNGPHGSGPGEGLSRVRLQDGTPGPLLREVIAADPRGFLGSETVEAMEFLCKYLDAAVRLPIQCHPDRDFARRHLHSEYGKAEAWVILDTRSIDGQLPYLLMGFTPGVTRAAFAQAVERQDIPAMEAMLNRLPVEPGDVFFIPARFPHAIGPGVFLLEVQEPSDWVVQPERRCAGTILSDADMWGPLDPPTGLDCFRYEGGTEAEVRARLQRHPQLRCATAGGRWERVIGHETTDCFGIDRLQVAVAFTLAHPKPYYLAVVVQGGGVIRWTAGEAEITRGDSFLVPHGLPKLEVLAGEESLELYLFLPGEL